MAQKYLLTLGARAKVNREHLNIQYLTLKVKSWLRGLASAPDNPFSLVETFTSAENVANAKRRLLTPYPADARQSPPRLVRSGQEEAEVTVVGVWGRASPPPRRCCRGFVLQVTSVLQ